MRRVILNMKDYIFADAVAKSLQVDEQGDFYPIPSYPAPCKGAGG